MKRGERPKTILLVQDEAEARARMRDILEDAGYVVLEAEDPSAAAARAEHHGGAIHLMLAPTALPQVTGPRLAEVLAPLRPEMRVLYIAEEPHDELDLDVPLDACLRQPFSAAVLVERVREVLARR